MRFFIKFTILLVIVNFIPLNVNAEFPYCDDVKKIENDCKNRGIMLITCLDEKQRKRYNRLKKTCEYYSNNENNPKESIGKIENHRMPTKKKRKKKTAKDNTEVYEGKITTFYQSSNNFWRATLKVDKRKNIKCVVYDDKDQPISASNFIVTAPADEILIRVQPSQHVVDHIECYGL
jgi:hypothetical protein